MKASAVRDYSQNMVSSMWPMEAKKQNHRKKTTESSRDSYVYDTFYAVCTPIGIFFLLMTL